MNAGNQAVVFDIPYVEERNRGTVAVRLILAIPHMIVMGVWSYLVALLTFIQWFIVLFTGKMPRSLFDFSLGAHRQAIQTQTYANLMTDVYPSPPGSGS